MLTYGWLAMLVFPGMAAFSQTQLRVLQSNFESGNYRTVVNEASQASFAQPTDSILFVKAYAHVKLNEVREAAATLKKLLRTNPDYSEAYFLKGLLAAKTEHYAEAISDFNRVLEAYPAYEKAWYNRALAKGLLEDYSGAVSDLDRCLALSPSYASAYYNRGYWHELQEHYIEAINDYKKAIDLEPHYPEAYMALAYVYAQSGDRPAACETLKKARAEGIEAANDLHQDLCP